MATDASTEPATQYADIFAALAEPFPPEEVKQRWADKARTRKLSYVTARTVMNRFDRVLGPENWSDAYREWGQHALICSITVTLPDGRTVSKSDIGGRADMPDADNDDKSAGSDAFKRAAVKFGVARYLYNDGTPFDDSPAPAPSPASNGHAPVGTNGTPTPSGMPASVAERLAKYGPPDNGKRLFMWAKDVEKEANVGMVKYLNDWARLQGFPGRMVDWDAEQVAEAFAAGSRKLGGPESQKTRVEPNPAPAATTAGIEPPDLHALKSRIASLTTSLCRMAKGDDNYQPTPPDLIGQLCSVQESHNLPQIASVRDCTDAAVLGQYADALSATFKSLSDIPF